jgi:hypothetical protein
MQHTIHKVPLVPLQHQHAAKYEPYLSSQNSKYATIPSASPPGAVDRTARVAPASDLSPTKTAGKYTDDKNMQQPMGAPNKRTQPDVLNRAAADNTLSAKCTLWSEAPEISTTTDSRRLSVDSNQPKVRQW